MQISILKRETEAPPTLPTQFSNSEGEWERRGNRLICHRRRPRRRTYQPDWKATELSQFEVQPHKA
eukprot:12927552-Prorocentrum_lima.AAC.1